MKAAGINRGMAEFRAGKGKAKGWRRKGQGGRFYTPAGSVEMRRSSRLCPGTDFESDIAMPRPSMYRLYTSTTRRERTLSVVPAFGHGRRLPAELAFSGR